MNNQEKLDAILEKLAVKYRKLNAKQQAFAIKEIDRVRGDIADLLADFADKDGIIQRRRLNRLLRELDEIESLIRQYGMTAMDEIIRESATFATTNINAGVASVIGVKAVAKAEFERINKDVFEYVVRRFGDDGLVLSDRVWDLSGSMRDEISTTLRADILKGEAISTMIANIRKVQDNDTWKINRLVVTEGNTAYRTATAMNASRSDVVKAVKMHRGRANRPKHRCTQLSIMDRYGMGVGIFKPTDSEIYNPHPNCTGYLTYVIDNKYL